MLSNAASHSDRMSLTESMMYAYVMISLPNETVIDFSYLKTLTNFHSWNLPPISQKKQT